MFLENPPQKINDIRKLFWIAFSFLILTFTVFAQVDPSFNPVPSNAASFTGGHTIQPDGKILVYGSFQIIQGVQKYGIARLNDDGSLDNSFNCAICDFGIGSAAVQTDGKIIVAGAKAGGGSANRLRRLNVDGSLDSSFTSPFPENPDGFNPQSGVWVIQPDGKMYVSQSFTFMGDPWSYLYRLNPTGSIDTSFTRMLFSWGMGQFGQKHLLADLKLMPDGKLLISGKHDYGFLFRVNPDGTKDNSFVSPVLTSVFTNPTLYVGSFDIQTDGKIPLVGNFSFINGVSKAGMARLNADQSVETSYTFPLPLGGSSSVTQKLRLLANDKLLISGQFAGKLVRLNPDASLDTGFNAPANMTELFGWQTDAAGRILATATFSGGVTTLARLNADGSRDTTFNVAFGVPPRRIYATVVTPDGKIVFTGGFSKVNNIARQGMARLNTDGSLDSAFDPGNGFNNDVYDLVAQPDGKILAIGIFQFFDGTPRNSIARVNADGSLDTAFNPTVANVAAIALQPDGKILIGGDFTTVNGTARTGLARLNADGSLDSSFNPILAGPTVVPLALLVQADGKIMVGGFFTTVNGVTREYLVRLNADGTLDASFDAGSSPLVRILTRQADGKYLISDRNQIYRRNPDGSVDASFQSIDFDNQFLIRDIMQQTDGTILVGGGFTRVSNDQTKKYLVRLAPNGTLQPDFLPGGANGQVNSFSKQADNKIILGGEITSIGGMTRFGIARLNAAVAPRRVFDYDGDGKADVSVFRASENKWYILQSSDFAVVQKVFAIAGDTPAPADYDGDGKTDVAIFRPSTGDWWYLSSINNAQIPIHWGQAGDIPRPSDFDGDGKADFIVYRPSNSVWYRFGSTGAVSILAFGIAEDKPLVGDFDGDGRSDQAIFRPSTGDWWYAASSAAGQFRATHWGASGDIPVPADYDGDGKTDFAVFRPSNGGWYIANSGNGSFTILAFGLSTDKPIAADYDGDGRSDIAVYRPSTGTWYLQQTTTGFGALQFGNATDIPTENAFIP